MPEPRYAKGRGGLVAYQTLGEGPIDLVYLTGVLSNLDVRWELPALAEFLERLASFSRLILFDRRGAGLSDHVPAEDLPTWEEWADDFGVVLDSVGSERAAIFAVADAGPMGMLYAATNPDRISALVLANTAAKYVAADDYPCGLDTDAAERVITVMESRWGTERFAAAIAPSAATDHGFLAWGAKYMRSSASPRAVAAQYRSLFEADFRPVLPTLRVPTLVMNGNSAAADVAQGRYLAEHIPGARFIQLPGTDNFVWTGDQDRLGAGPAPGHRGRDRKDHRGNRNTAF